jgi:hypothetical protein
LASWSPVPRVESFNAAAAARGELGEQLVFVVAVAMRRGPGTMAVHVAAVAARRELGNHSTMHVA